MYLNHEAHVGVIINGTIYLPTKGRHQRKFKLVKIRFSLEDIHKKKCFLVVDSLWYPPPPKKLGGFKFFFSLERV